VTSIDSFFEHSLACGRAVKKFLQNAWNRDEGVLSFEWVLLCTLLAVGIVSGIAASRDAIIDELGDVSQGIICLDQSFSIDFPLLITIAGDGMGGVDYDGSSSDSSFTDSSNFDDCPRTAAPGGQGSTADFSGPTP